MHATHDLAAPRSASQAMHSATCSSVLAGLAELRHALDTTASSDAIGAFAIELRTIERRVAGLLCLVGQRAAALAAKGEGAPAVEVLTADGIATASQAAADAARAGLAPTFPTITEGVVSGAVSGSHADVLLGVTSKMDDTEVEALSRHDAELADAAERLPADSFARRVRRVRDRIRKDSGRDDSARARAEAGGQVGLTRDRRHVRLHALLPILDGTPLRSALHAEHARLAATNALDPDQRHDQQLNQALISLIVRGANAPLDSPNAGRINATINVVCDAETFFGNARSEQTDDRPRNDESQVSLTETLDGGLLTRTEVGRLCCEAGVRRTAAATNGDVMATVESRTATQAQRAALFALYGSCAISGADWSQVEVHHVRFHEDGGKTRIDNLVPISRRWHHLVHDQGWTLEMDPDRTLHLFRPDGVLDRTLPPPVPLLERRRTEHQLAA